MSNVAVCSGCDQPTPPDKKRYRIIEEYPRMTVAYYCHKCWGIIHRITGIRR